jgi:predicted DNA-binding transcriptional regulator YafY
MSGLTRIGQTIVSTQAHLKLGITREKLEDAKIKVTYTNYRGETARRTITPLGLIYGTTQHHHVEQWLLNVWDHDREAIRTYALDDCDFTAPA